MEDVIAQWHEAVNSGDRQRAIALVTDPIVVLGPKGAGPITPDQFAEWIVRSGIKLVPRDWHPVDEHCVVVEEDATWPDNPEPTRVATVFRLSDGKVAAALRKPDLASALELATELSR
ncbi:nuclear transport factor 2 family protein [Labedaea rhizosphaerae]|uniref:SnoaL-like protein n=1 Tax=Labedaea rhizosphaerae TaxID=598644 RepID=A0A4R6SM49_LABRH|nr:nuclear transport factor 2 family protein [Labedaea rhizosphaerae]TDQ05199.1 SnoaL-like protein [Labedaea rhizosphaerae]